ncbi:unnamed protein product [Taenia asiatica]|uniref:PK domain-containing protein n=1 Tax=Taenia asiatica TaxID=60517 RepID=A0A158R6V1_TAEAS|nr:unnamed protein product [Taenia asiatica]
MNLNGRREELQKELKQQASLMVDSSSVDVDESVSMEVKKSKTAIVMCTKERQHANVVMPVITLFSLTHAYFPAPTDSALHYGKVEIIANDQSAQTKPSYVAFTDKERLISDVTMPKLAVTCMMEHLSEAVIEVLE